QAEDGIRDFHVTGVQTCALPICLRPPLLRPRRRRVARALRVAPARGRAAALRRLRGGRPPGDRRTQHHRRLGPHAVRAQRVRTRDMDEFSGIAAWLPATGPYGIVAILGWAFWKINERKDAALRELYERVAEMGRTQTEAMVKVEAALVALKEAIEEMHDRLPPPGRATP